ncbi:MAG: tautomerase family protein [Burkholderiales bacterium]|nr:tautomerase family protein [Burkholderiales bacterium]MDE1926250.1 tautomerase family protein [Burkholderiales bacterium]MDE2158958.1 tautomerase family protein [Burkholderiales bacterium]MDE2503042.1 tautomerase family protein [Burkholderiales bacterium]
MPSITIEIRKRYDREVESALMQAVHEVMVEAFKVSPRHRNVTLVVHEPHRFIGRTDCPAPDCLTNVSIFLLPGRSTAAKRRLYAGLAERLEGFGIPRRCLLVKIHELPAENFGVRGGQALCDVELGYPVDV